MLAKMGFCNLQLSARCCSTLGRPRWLRRGTTLEIQRQAAVAGDAYLGGGGNWWHGGGDGDDDGQRAETATTTAETTPTASAAHAHGRPGPGQFCAGTLRGRKSTVRTPYGAGSGGDAQRAESAEMPIG